MKNKVLYTFGIFFFILISYSFFLKWARIDSIVFSAKNFWIEEEQKKKLIKELEEKIKPYHGSWIWNLPIRKLSKIVKQHPKVEEVQILRSWPNHFHIVLLSNPPVLLWIGNKVFYPITTRGTLLSPLDISKIPDLPLLRGQIFFDHLEWRKKAVQLIQHLPQTGWFSQKNISEIKYSTKDSNFYLYLLHEPSPIRVGENLVEFRPDRVESVLRYLEQKNINWRVIDARFSQKVVVSLDNDS